MKNYPAKDYSPKWDIPIREMTEEEWAEGESRCVHSSKETGYFGRSGEKHGMWGRRHTEESRRGMSENHIDVSGELNPMFGVKHSKESIQKMSENRKGKGRQPKSPETREKMRQAALRRWAQ